MLFFRIKSYSWLMVEIEHCFGSGLFLLCYHVQYAIEEPEIHY